MNQNTSGSFTTQPNIQKMSIGNSNADVDIHGDFSQQSMDVSEIELDNSSGSDASIGGCLGLNLTVTPAFCNLIDENLARGRAKNDHLICTSGSTAPQKFRASKFEVSSLVIGTWEKKSARGGELEGKCYYSKKRIVWEILDGDRKKKIEIKYDYIDAIRAIIHENEPGMLQIEINQPPEFAVEGPPQPRKHTIWDEGSDFTDNNALLFRRHTVTCPPGALDKHYQQLLQSNSRLLEMSQKPFSTDEYPVFMSVITTLGHVQQQTHRDVSRLNPHIPGRGFFHNDGNFMNGTLNLNHSQEDGLLIDDLQEQEHPIQNYLIPDHVYSSDARIYNDNPNMAQLIQETNTANPLLDQLWEQSSLDKDVLVPTVPQLISHSPTLVCNGESRMDFSGENSIKPS